MSPVRTGCRVRSYVHDMSRGTSCLVEFHNLLYSMPRENEDFHGKFFNFTHEYLRVSMCGPPRVSEVTLERYRILDATFAICFQ